MRVTINGESESVERDTSVADLLALRQLEPLQVAVEVNENVVPRRTFRETMIHDGDRIEVVTFVGGG